MDEVDAAFIWPEPSKQSYKRWSSAVNAKLELTKSFDEGDPSAESAKGLDEVDASFELTKGFDEVESSLKLIKSFEVDTSIRLTKSFDEETSSSKIVKSFDEVDSSVPSPADLTSYLDLDAGHLPNDSEYEVVSPAELALQLRAGMDKYLLIDSRSFLEYNTSHIQQSCNVCCSKIVKRRLQRDKVLIKDLLTQTCHIDIDEYDEVIVYDQCTENPKNLTDDTFLCVLLKKLVTAFRRVMLLKGGFLAFQAMYPSLCESKTNNYRCAALTSLSQPCLPVSNVGPTKILPFLYLGSQQDALSQDVTQVNDISYILNVSTTCIKPPHIPDGHFLRIPVNDNYSAKLQPYFSEAFQFLDKVREANGCVLVHCLAGISRSPTLAIAYIMRHLDMTSDEAYRYVKDKRPTISPNFNFLGQLLEFEKDLKREKELNNNGTNTIAQKPEARPWSNYVMDLSSHSPSSPVAKTFRPFVFETSGSQGTNLGSVSQNVSDSKSDSNEQNEHTSTEKHLETETISERLVLQTDCPFPSNPDLTENQSKSESTKVVKDILSFTFPLDSTRTRSHPSVLNLDASRRSPFSFPSEMNTSQSLTQISEVTECETPSPLALPSGESTISTSFVQYESKLTGTFKPLFPFGETSSLVTDSSNMEVDQSYSNLSFHRKIRNHSESYLTSKNTTESEHDLGLLRKSQSCMSHLSDVRTSHGSTSDIKPTHGDNSVTTSVKSTPFSLQMCSGKKPLRSSLSLSLSPIVPIKPLAANSGENKSVSSMKHKNINLIERKTDVGKGESMDKAEPHKDNFRTVDISDNIPSCTKTVTRGQKVALKSFSVTSPCLNAHSPSTPTMSLAKLNFSMTENEKHGKCYETKVEAFVNENMPKSIENDSLSTKSIPATRLYSFPTTSLDKLNFTPCLSKMSEKDFKNDQNNIHTSPPRTSGVKRPLNNNVLDLQDEDATSPMSVSSTMSTSSSSSHTSSSVSSPLSNGIPTKVVVRKRERKPNRPNVRPNSIAFSKYPTFDLGSDCQDSPNSSGSTTSQDDSSEIYIQNGKKSKQSECMPDIRFRFGRYCEREVYMQITAAMESAMMKSQAFEATRKSRSLDDILSSEDDSSSPNCEFSTFDRVLRHCALTRDRYSAPAGLFENLACRGTSDPYNSNSSLSSGGSRASLHGSVELIQVS